jgi:hypothetical protein
LQKDEGRKKAVVRAIRIDKNLDDVLRQDAKNRGISTSSHLNSILARYSEWDRLSERFGYVSLHRTTIKRIFENMNEELLQLLAKEIGSTRIREYMRIFHREITIPSYLEWVELFYKYSNTGEVEINHKQNLTTIIVGHELGEKWSKFQSLIISETMRDLFHITPKIDISDRMVIVRFSNDTA